jgi:hypothetical protein
MTEIWQNPDGTWSHSHDAKCKWQDREACATDLKFHREWQKWSVLND